MPNSSQCSSGITSWLVGFYGAGSTSGFGNSHFEAAAVGKGVNHLYSHNSSISAINDLFTAIDCNNDRQITENEIAGLTVKICGYSWGGVGAIGMSQTLSSPGPIVVGGSPSHPITWNLHVPIPIKTVFVFDPVPILNPPGQVPDTVENFYNYYQDKGGDSIFRATGNYPDELIGSPLSRLLKGTSVSVAPGVTDEQVNVTNDPSISRTGTPFLGSGNNNQYSLSGPDTNHDGVPWLVTPEFNSKF